MTSRTSLPARLLAPEPGWTTEADVVVVGSGIAGLTVARCTARAAGLRVLLVTKALLEAGSTRWAQGGIAAALGEGDTRAAPARHARRRRRALRRGRRARPRHRGARCRARADRSAAPASTTTRTASCR